MSFSHIISTCLVGTVLLALNIKNSSVCMVLLFVTDGLSILPDLQTIRLCSRTRNQSRSARRTRLQLPSCSTSWLRLVIINIYISQLQIICYSLSGPYIQQYVPFYLFFSPSLASRLVQSHIKDHIYITLITLSQYSNYIYIYITVLI